GAVELVAAVILNLLAGFAALLFHDLFAAVNLPREFNRIRIFARDQKDQVLIGAIARFIYQAVPVCLVIAGGQIDHQLNMILFASQTAHAVIAGPDFQTGGDGETAAQRRSRQRVNRSSQRIVEDALNFDVAQADQPAFLFYVTQLLAQEIEAAFF